MSPPQNNQLQELPYNELSRLSGLRTLNLHNNLISSEGEGNTGGCPPWLGPSSPLPPPCWVCGQLCGTSQNCPLLSRMETRDGVGSGGLWLLWTGRGCLEEPLPVPGQEPWGSWEHRLPLPTPRSQAWGRLNTHSAPRPAR